MAYDSLLQSFTDLCSLHFRHFNSGRALGWRECIVVITMTTRVNNSIKLSRLSTFNLWLLFETASLDVEVAWTPIDSLHPHTHTDAHTHGRRHQHTIDVITFRCRRVRPRCPIPRRSGPPSTRHCRRWWVPVLGRLGTPFGLWIRTTRCFFRDTVFCILMFCFLFGTSLIFNCFLFVVLPSVSHSFIHSFTFNSRLKAHAVEYNGKNTLTVKIKS